MAQEILIIGESGTGKSTSMERLDPKSTFIFNVAKKPLPFRGWRKGYLPLNKENPQGNYIATDNHATITATMKHIDNNMPHIITVIIDDFQYLMANEYMKRAHEKGFDKFTDIGAHAWEVIHRGKNMRDDITFIMFGHAEQSNDLSGTRRLKFKTVGKLVDNVITVEGLFTIVFFTDVNANEAGKVEYGFLTHSDGTNTAKTPKGMFASDKIPNDLKSVITKVNEYYN